MRKKSFHLQALLLSLCTICCILLVNTRADEPKYLIGACPKKPPLTPNSTYRDNLKTLFPLLVAKSATSLTGFYQTSAGEEPTQIAYGLFLCRGDLSTEACNNCVFAATNEVRNKCESMDGTFWWDQCMLRHSYNQNFTVLDQSVYYKSTTTTENVTDPDRLKRVLGDTLKDLAKRASTGGSDHKKFAAGEAEYSNTEKLYGLAQCTPDLTPEQCNYCLRDGISKLPICCANARGAMVSFFSCGIRYEFYPFYNTTAVPSPPPPAVKRRKGGMISSRSLAAIIIAVCVSVFLFIAVVGFRWLKKRNYNSIIQEDSKNAAHDHDITMERCKQYDLATIQVATANFSPRNKIGQGAFGSVYKGILSDGQAIAVKRLSGGPNQGYLEFKNEVEVVAKLQHRNLVSLLGFCYEAEEKILVYEFVPNKSLDHLLFDPEKRAKLVWSTRYKIIRDIASGMQYLHVDSRHRIIHRDLKAANILLDGDMTAKVADFGLARIFDRDQTHGNTNKVAGTFGYISPEYYLYGHFSVKSDVFSFGVLILEIISGVRNNGNFHLSDCSNLKGYAWKLWEEGRPLDLIDDVLQGYTESEVRRCIHIGLLCVQDDPDSRPSMQTVLLGLNSHLDTFQIPLKPTSVDPNQAGPTLPNMKDPSTSQPIPPSVDEASITDLYPR